MYEGNFICLMVNVQREGELDKTLAERTTSVDPLNLIWVIPAEGEKDK